MKKIVLFNKSAAATAAAMPQNQKNIKNRSRVHSKDSMFQFLERSDNIYYPHGKIRWNGNLRRFSGVLAALSVSVIHS